MFRLPHLPAPLRELPSFLARHPQDSILNLLKPYRDYEQQLRSLYAQDKEHAILKDPYVNVVPLFTEHTKLITTRARNVEDESAEERSKYIMPLPADKRRENGSPATVATLSEFRRNFGIFSESSMSDMDWNNVVVAGSSVVSCLLPVPPEYSGNKRELREYYHQRYCPASDVDLFLYGLSHEEAIEKIKQIEQCVRNAILEEVTVIRTRHAITIASKYPIRHVQIVLRVYSSVSEILTGFDIDAAGAAYDGQQVWVTPRALGSFMTQINHIDLSRRSPSYENRLSKYANRNFEVYWPDLDRSRIDPTIYERSFQQTLGLARLLVLEQLPSSTARSQYRKKRREEKGRPVQGEVNKFAQRGDIKVEYEDEVAEWAVEQDISNYHTFTIPYGERFNARRLEKLCYTRDLLLNAEWNQEGNKRDVYLHRHPAFFGSTVDVIEDCCGSCPKPMTQEEVEVADKDASIYISGKLSFLTDDPGRQQIGSFNPSTEDDWTNMAYVAEMDRLCGLIVAKDLAGVNAWLARPPADLTQRDHTGRTPLHLAVMTSSAAIVRTLIDHGSRITARLADGKTALHLAASRGDVEMIKALMEKSTENEEAEAERDAKRRQSARRNTKRRRRSDGLGELGRADQSGLVNEADLVSTVDAVTETTTDDGVSMLTGSFVDVRHDLGSKEGTDVGGLDDQDEPDFYDINVLAWDIACSPLHLAIARGQEDAVKELCEWGASPVLPVIVGETAILTLFIPMFLPKQQGIPMTQLLLKLGATCAQANQAGLTALHQSIHSERRDITELFMTADPRGARVSVNHMTATGVTYWRIIISPMESAIRSGSPVTFVEKLLATGAQVEVDYDTWLKSAKPYERYSRGLGLPDFESDFQQHLVQPLMVAVEEGQAEIASHLLEKGANPSTVNNVGLQLLDGRVAYGGDSNSVLDVVQQTLKLLRQYDGSEVLSKPQLPTNFAETLSSIPVGSYRHWYVRHRVEFAKASNKLHMKMYKDRVEEEAPQAGVAEKSRIINDAVREMEKLEKDIIARGGKKFSDLYPNFSEGQHQRHFAERQAGSHSLLGRAGPNSLLALVDTSIKSAVKFEGDAKLSDARGVGYERLMEAVWRGDLDAVRALTLQAWGPDEAHAPLKMAIKDSTWNSPFSLAVCLRNFPMATAILEIVQAQWSPKEDEKQKYKIRSGSEDYEESYSEDGSEADPDDVAIVAEKVRQDMTMEDVGKVSLEVESHMTPLDVMVASCAAFSLDSNGKPLYGSFTTRTSTFREAIKHEDLEGLRYLIETAEKFALKTPSNGDALRRFVLPIHDFEETLLHEKIDIMGFLIKRLGAGLPMEHLVRVAGLEDRKESRFYQGLTVRGSKRRDWATAGRQQPSVGDAESPHPPLLQAAIQGKLESVQFFLGETPQRLYSQFGKGEAAQRDPQVQLLSETPEGFDHHVSRWLNTNRDLLIHCAVLAQRHDAASTTQLEYLVRNFPGQLEKRTSIGDTPLMLACRMGRLKFVKVLLNAGADQSVTNNNGENIIHALMETGPSAEQLRAFLDMLDPVLRDDLFLQRTSMSHLGLTPLHFWLFKMIGAPTEFDLSGHHKLFYQSRGRGYMRRHATVKSYPNPLAGVETLHTLLEYSSGEELEMLNAAGVTPLHTVAGGKNLALFRAIAACRPSTLQREDAVGCTPMEKVQEQLLEERLSKKPRSAPSRWRYETPRLQQLVQNKPKTFLQKGSSKVEDPEKLASQLREHGLSGDYDEKDYKPLLYAMGVEPDEAFPTYEAFVEAAWDMCETLSKKHPAARRLASLNEANTVIKRVSDSLQGSRYYTRQMESRHGREQRPINEAAKLPDQDIITTRLSCIEDLAWRDDDAEDKAKREAEEKEKEEDEGEDQARTEAEEGDLAQGVSTSFISNRGPKQLM